MNDRTSATKSLNHLAIIARELINAAISEGNLLHSDELFYRNQIDDFEYGEKGVKVGRMSSQFIIKKTWFLSCVPDITQALKETKEFSDTVDILKEISPDLKLIEIFPSLLNFLNDLIKLCLPDSGYEENDIGRLIAACLDSILEKDKLLRYVAEVELTKVVIIVPQLEFDAAGFDKIILRPINAKDLEYEFPAHDFSFGNVKPYVGSMLADFAYPSAILKIECLSRNADDIVYRIKKAISILRLFQTAGVDIVHHKISVEPWIAFRSSGSLSTTYSGPQRYINTFGSYVITKQNSEKFINFWRKLASSIPDSFYKSGEVTPNYLTIAYQRYCEALIDTSTAEAMVTSAVMGLEALLLHENIEGELAFRLRTYGSKVLGLFGYNSLVVKDALKMAYSIRSSFVHGSKLSKKKEEKLIQQYSSFHEFNLLIVDYLRIFIILALIIKKTKGSYLQLIDDALVSGIKLKELDEIYAGVKTLL